MTFRRSLIGLAIVLAACSSRPGAEARAPAPSAVVHPESGLAVVPLMVRRGTQKLPFKVEVARTGAEQAKGLMFRTAMGANEGMIFPFDPPRAGVAFWMKNTVIPLDIIFIGADHRIVNIANAVPYSLDPLPAAGPVSGVLEINGGRAAQLGIAAGDKVEW